MENQLLQKIDELTKRIHKLETDRFTFPIKLSELEKKTINNVFYISGQITISNPAGTAHLPISGLSADNIVLVSCGIGGSGSVSASIVPSVSFPPYNEIYFEGTVGDVVSFIVFLTAKKNMDL